jgi:hypothetical protein
VQCPIAKQRTTSGEYDSGLRHVTEIAVEHIRISSGRPFAEVRHKLEGAVPKLDGSIVNSLASSDQGRAKDYEDNGPQLSIFLERDHGALLQIAGGRRSAIQYEIGNPFTASKMRPRCGWFSLRMSKVEVYLNTTKRRPSLGL